MTAPSTLAPVAQGARGLRFSPRQAVAPISHGLVPHAQPVPGPSECAAQPSPAMDPAMTLSPHPWDPLEDPAVWLHPLQPSASQPPLLLQLDRQRWALRPLADSPALAWLTPQERQQAERLRRPEDRERHLLGRAGLRRLLGLWHRYPPQGVPLRRDCHGKPFCPLGPHFNLSHSGDLILLALHSDYPLGVDVEQLRPQLEWRPLAERLLCDAECRELERLPTQVQPQAFLQAWCRLEARLKASGLGLAGLEALRRQAELAWAEGVREPGPRPGAPLGLRPGGAGASDGSARDGRRLAGLGLRGGETLWDLRLPPGYCGALACLVGLPNPARTDRAPDGDRPEVVQLLGEAEGEGGIAVRAPAEALGRPVAGGGAGAL